MENTMSGKKITTLDKIRELFPYTPDFMTRYINGDFGIPSRNALEFLAQGILGHGNKEYAYGAYNLWSNTIPDQNRLTQLFQKSPQGYRNMGIFVSFVALSKLDPWWVWRRLTEYIYCDDVGFKICNLSMAYRNYFVLFNSPAKNFNFLNGYTENHPGVVGKIPRSIIYVDGIPLIEFVSSKPGATLDYMCKRSKELVTELRIGNFDYPRPERSSKDPKYPKAQPPVVEEPPYPLDDPENYQTPWTSPMCLAPTEWESSGSPSQEEPTPEKLVYMGPNLVFKRVIIHNGNVSFEKLS